MRTAGELESADGERRMVATDRLERGIELVQLLRASLGADSDATRAAERTLGGLVSRR